MLDHDRVECYFLDAIQIFVDSIYLFFRQPGFTGPYVHLKSQKHHRDASRDNTQLFDFAYSYLHDLLENLDGVMQSPKYHPEGDALYHSLQVFECSIACSKDPKLWAAALFHDVGKAIDYPNHDKAGAQALFGILDANICWLIEHHLDLLICPTKTRRKYQGSRQLADLEKLRRWDLQGRMPHAIVMDIDEALDMLTPHFKAIIISC